MVFWSQLFDCCWWWYKLIFQSDDEPFSLLLLLLLFTVSWTSSLLLMTCWLDTTLYSMASVLGSLFLFLLATSPARRVLLAMILSTSYLVMSKLVTAFNPRNLIAAISYASAASSWVPNLIHKKMNLVLKYYQHKKWLFKTKKMLSILLYMINYDFFLLNDSIKYFW